MSDFKFYVNWDNTNVLALRFRGMQPEIYSARYFRRNEYQSEADHYVWLVALEKTDYKRIDWKKWHERTRAEIQNLVGVDKQPMKGPELLQRLDDIISGHVTPRIVKTHFDKPEKENF